ncbi:MAG: hypothetical protein L0H25_07545, partial [Micrococcales bacterium]|nr:hypothetical protein [Micrococcales bacterium]
MATAAAGASGAAGSRGDAGPAAGETNDPSGADPSGADPAGRRAVETVAPIRETTLETDVVCDLLAVASRSGRRSDPGEVTATAPMLATPAGARVAGCRATPLVGSGATARDQAAATEALAAR